MGCCRCHQVGDAVLCFCKALCRAGYTRGPLHNVGALVRHMVAWCDCSFRALIFHRPLPVKRGLRAVQWASLARALPAHGNCYHNEADAQECNCTAAPTLRHGMPTRSRQTVCALFAAWQSHEMSGCPGCQCRPVSPAVPVIES